MKSKELVFKTHNLFRRTQQFIIAGSSLCVTLQLDSVWKNSSYLQILIDFDFINIINMVWLVFCFVLFNIWNQLSFIGVIGFQKHWWVLQLTCHRLWIISVGLRNASVEKRSLGTVIRVCVEMIYFAWVTMLCSSVALSVWRPQNCM